MKPLEGKVALVAGATRGAGRGIACMLGEAGATVYCTGRSVRGKPATAGRPETIEETAELVGAHGGRGFHVQTDHTIEEQVESLFKRVEKEQGRLDILVNDVWGGDELTEWGKPFWEHSLEKGLVMLERAIHSHIITSRHGVPLMLCSGGGLVVEITDGDAEANTLYRQNLYYDLVKISVIRIAFGMAHDLRDTGVTAVALTPGFLRSEMMLEHFGVTEETWMEAIEKDPTFAESETPFFVGRAVAALAADPDVAAKAGEALSTWKLAREYGFTDVDGRRPDVGAHIAAQLDERWGRLVAAVRSELAGRGLDARTDLEHERKGLRLRGRLEGGWYSRTILVTELWSPGPEQAAVTFRERYLEALERSRTR